MRPRSRQTTLSPVAASSLHTIVPATPAPTSTTSTASSLVTVIAAFPENHVTSLPQDKRNTAPLADGTQLVGQRRRKRDAFPQTLLALQCLGIACHQNRLRGVGRSRMVHFVDELIHIVLECALGSKSFRIDRHEEVADVVRGGFRLRHHSNG